LILGQVAMKVDTRPFPDVNMVEGHRDAGEWSTRRRDAAMRRRGPVPAIGPEKAKGSTSP
jgi:hypothetical protein